MSMDARPSHIEHARIVAKTISEFWEHSRVIQAVLSTADLDDFDDCIRALLRVCIVYVWSQSVSH